MSNLPSSITGVPGFQNIYQYSSYAIYDSIRRRLIPLTFTPAEEQFSIATNYDYQQLTGRGGQVASYGGTNSMNITLTFDAVQGYLPPGYLTIDWYLQDLRALCYKDLNGDPPECELRLGNNKYTGYVNTVQITKKGPFDKASNRIFATITIQFTEKDETHRQMGGFI